MVIYLGDSPSVLILEFLFRKELCENLIGRGGKPESLLAEHFVSS